MNQLAQCIIVFIGGCMLIFGVAAIMFVVEAAPEEEKDE